MHYKFHKINLNCCGSYIDSYDWIKQKKALINPINKKDNKCFQYAVTVVLNYKKIKKDPQKIIKIKPFINKYNLEVTNYPSEKDHWKKLDKNNVGIALNVLKKRRKNISCYVSKRNSNDEKQVIVLLILNRDKGLAKSKGREARSEGWQQWPYLAAKKPSALLRGITLKHHGEFYFLNCYHSFQKTNFSCIKEYVKIKIFVTL